MGRDHIAGVWRAYCLYAAGDLEAAQSTLAHTETLRALDLHVITHVLQNVRSWIAFGAGDMARALACNESANHIAQTLGPVTGLAIGLSNRAYMSIAHGQMAWAEQALERLASNHSLIEYVHTAGAISLLRAWAAYVSGEREACARSLKDALTRARDERHRLRMRAYPKALAAVLPIAFHEGIAIDAAITLVRECGIAPPATAPESWPWPVKVYTLGRFEVSCNGAALAFGRKAPKRTIALLKALIALGGNDVPEARLADALWPDLDGDAAMECLAAALHRLRRLLGSNDAIVQRSGLLSVNRKHCFVDAWAFEAGLEKSGKLTETLPLYRGAFLAADGDAPWSEPMRERLRSKFEYAVGVAGRDREAAGRFHEALAMYSTGIEVDGLIEAFYQGAMRCLIELGRTSEAAAQYKLLSRTFSRMLGLAPSVESRRLYDSLRLE